MQVNIRVVGLARHEATTTCCRTTAQKVQYAAATAGARALERRFTACGAELKQVNVFKYLGRLLSFYGNNVPAIRHNLRKARGVWMYIARVLAKE